MPAFPAFKTKPYYDALKTWLLESHNEDGTLKSSAVQAEVSAAIAAEPTVVDAAAAAVDAQIVNIAAGSKEATLTFTIDGGGSAIVAGASADVRVPWPCTVTGWSVVADQSGSFVATVSTATQAAYPTFTAISGTEKPTLSSAQKAEDTALTTWTTAIADNSWVRLTVDSAATVERVTVALEVERPAVVVGGEGGGVDIPGQFVVTEYGATGDGVTDDTLAIRAAIADAETYEATYGAAVVFFPAGVYKVYPQTATGENIFAVAGSNLHFLGVGKYSSILDCYVSGGRDPSASWDSVGGAVWRGSAFKLAGGTSGAPQQNITFEKLGIAGNASYTSNTTFPANTSTGDGWDITHKAVYVQEDTYTDNIVVRDCDLHGWRGELFYAGGLNHGDVEIRDSLFHTAPDGVSGGGNFHVHHNEFHTLAHAGVEDFPPRGKSHRYHHNWFHDIETFGVSLRHAGPGATTGSTTGTDNIFERCDSGGLYHGPLGNSDWHHNRFIDCGTAGNFATAAVVLTTSQHSNAQEYVLSNVRIHDNLMQCVGRNLPDAFVLNLYGYTGTGLNATGDPYADGVWIENNTVETTEAAKAAGYAYNSSFGALPPTPAGSKLIINRNRALDVTYSDMIDGQAHDYLLTGTAVEEVTAYRPIQTKLHVVHIAGRVVTAATTLTIVVRYYNASGTQTDETVMSAVSVPVGGFTLNPITVMAQGGSEAKKIRVRVTAGTANQVYLTVSTQEVERLV